MGCYDLFPMDATHSRLRTARWILGGAVFAAAATILFEAAGQSSSRPAGVGVNGYRPVPTTDPDVKTALNFALADQKKKNRGDGALALVSVLSAERQAPKGDNVRLCLSLERRGRSDTARAVVRRNAKDQWSVALWAWGACGKQALQAR